MKKPPPSVTFFALFRRSSRRLKAAMVVVLSFALGSAGLHAQQGPAGGTVRAGDARISGEGSSSTRIDQTSERAIIDWRSFGIGANDEVIFRQPSTQSATLNRVTGQQVSVILGRLDANGTVLLVNPNGVVFGGGAQVNVGSLIASTSNISDANFMSGKLVFDAPGRIGAGILNSGAMTARDGGLVALVAPHVRNDGVIVARLGKVMLGAADTFTVDLYGDALVNLALSDGHAGQLVGLNGEPITSLIHNKGRIEAGQTVLMTARNAKAVLDNLINMSGTIKADSAIQQGGRILLLGEGGRVDVNGSISAQGTTGGSIQVLGDGVRLGSGASLDASGISGGGSVQVGGAYQGRGGTYRSTTTTVESGATVKANAISRGNGGDAVIWSDGHTQFLGTVEAKGGVERGNGGQLEVSGKSTLEFLGRADASAAAGTAGTLLLDPETLSIGANEAGAIMRVLRTGTTTNLQADVDINVDSPILGGDRSTGGGLNLTAGNNINVNDFIVTNNGAINLTATLGTVNVAPGIAVFAGAAPITITAGTDLRTGSLVTTGALAIRSISGAVAIDAFIDEHTGPVDIRAAGAVDINQPIVSLASGSPLTITAGTDVNVNAQVDGRGSVEGGAVSVTANRDLNVNQAIVTNNGNISLTATNGAIQQVAPLVTGTGALTLDAGGNVTAGQISAGALNVTSSGGSVAMNGIIDSASGDARIAAASDVTIAGAVLNGQSGGALSVTAGRDVTVAGVIDGRGGVAGGAVSLSAARNVNLSDYVLTNNGAVNITAANGTIGADKGIFSGTGAIAMRSAGDLTTGVVSGSSLAATSSAGSVRVNGVIDGTTGRVDLTAARDVSINSAIGNGRTGGALSATAGNDVIVNGMIDGRGGAAGGGVALKAGRAVAVNNSVVTNNGGVDITAGTGSIVMAGGTAIVSGASPISMTAGSDIRTQGISGGSLSATSGGTISVDGLIDGNTGRVTLTAARDVNINAPVLNARTGATLTAAAGGNINVNAQIDGTNGRASGGEVKLTANGDVIVNAPITTQNGGIYLSATTGAATVVPAAGLYAGAAPISLDALGNVMTSTISGGIINIDSRGGSVFVTGQISGIGGPMTIGAAGKVDIAHAITNLGASPLSITAGTDIDVSAAVGRTAAGVPSGSVALTAGQNVHLNDSIVTQDGAISVTATNGTISTAAGEGLFAGSGAIFVQSGQTLSTMPTVTTGTLTMRSTGGSVNVDTAINGATGAVTIDAANDVNINSAIANPRENAPLTVTAGHDINVKVAIDGRDSASSVKSGSVTLNAGNNIALNQSIVSEDAAISLTARDGTVTTATSEGLFAGSGAIAVTTGATLDTGITSTTGSLTLRSTGGAVNVNQPIADTTGAVSISAGTAVNINQQITNLKSGGDLTVNAGTDINVLAGVDGRSGALAGGAVTMTAGNGITVVSPIATNDGAISLTATNGSVVLPVGTEVIDSSDPAHPAIATPMQASILAGNAPVSITSGGNFTLSSPVKTTGALTLVTTSGNLTTAAPIDDTTGVVTISAGNGLIVNREINSNNQAITLNAGAGGILINQIVDYDYRQISSVNPNQANLTLRSVGDITILDTDGVASGKNLTIDTRGRITDGIVGLANTTGINDRPQNLFLNADGGISTFTTGFAGNIEATSSGGSISLIVNDPDRLRITTGTPGTLDCPTCNITLISNHFDAYIGPDVVLNAGGSILMPNTFKTETAEFTARSGDININDLSIFNDRFTGTAGRDINFGGLLWLGGGPLTLTAGRDIAGPALGIHVSNSQLATFIANRHLTLFTLETLGAVNLTSTTGNITLNTDIGGHIVNTTLAPDFNPGDLGVASFTLSAPAATAVVNTQGVRAQGNVTISTGGTLTAAKQITSVFGSVSIFAAGGANLSAVPIGNVNQLILPGGASPVSSPGPRQPIPTAPGLIGNGAPGAPAFAEIGVSAADQIVGGIVLPGGANGGVAVRQTSNAANAPGRTSGVNGRPGASPGVSLTQPIGGTDQAGIDTASALRAAGEKCEESSSSDNGLAAAAPNSDSASAPGQSNGSCAAAAPSGGAAAAPAAPASGAPGAKPTPTATPNKQGAGSQRQN